MRHVLITGAGSYVGTNVELWLRQFPDKYEIHTLDMRGNAWKQHDFSKYQVVFHVAAIVHLNSGRESASIRNQYYEVNTELAFETAEKAKISGVEQFIFMSSMSVYGETGYITHNTEPAPQSFYGDSKWQAEQRIQGLSDTGFKVAVLRPPMVYGKGAKGNYPVLSKLAGKTIVFPRTENRRSMVYIGNLCEFIRLLIDNEDEGLFFPQDKQWINTCDMVREIADVRNHHIWFTGMLRPCVMIGKKFPGRIGKMCRKAFGDCCYDMEMSEYRDEYRIYSLAEAIEQTEG